MDITALKKNELRITVALLILFMAVALVLRIIPWILTRDQAFFPIYDTDTWYTLRQIEVMVHNFPQYDWFDPMTAYPAGKVIDWGPGLPFAAALLCIVSGASTQAAVVAASGFISPLMAVLMVPVIFLLGSVIADRKTGIVAAGLVSFTSFLYFTFSSYGMVDHHIAEVLFSTLFVLAYLLAMRYAEIHLTEGKDRNTLLMVVGLGILAGLLYSAALLISTTVLLIFFIAAIYLFLQNIADFLADRDPAYFCLLNLTVSCTAVVILLLFGFRQEGMSVMSYSPGLVLVHGAVVAESLILYGLAKILRGKRTQYLLVLGGLILAGFASLVAVPALGHVAAQAMHLIFGYSPFSIGVQETLPWSVAGAFDAINVAIILVAGGFLVTGYRLRHNPGRGMIFFAVWSVVMLLLTLQFQRFQYYFTVNIALLAALCITEPFRWDLPWPRADDPAVSRAPVPDPRRPGEKQGKRKKPAPDAVPGNSGFRRTLMLACLAGVCLLTVLHTGLSLSQDFHYASAAKDREIPADWLESLTWLREQTPDPGIGYFDRYEKAGYTAPVDSYGILAVWDAGHWITFFSHRMPVTNPFQDNLAGSNGAAAFFLSDNETRADGIRGNFHARYVITDSGMVVDRFTNLVPWVSGSADISPYIKWFLVPDPHDASRLRKTHLFDDAYYQTMAVRLHTFDGSLTEPSRAEYLRYTIRKPTALETADASGFSRIVTSQGIISVPDANQTATPILAEGPDLMPTTYADIFSTAPDKPLSTVPALAHYRLVHESPANATVTPFPESEPLTMNGTKMVKIFEYVRGAHIPGEGIIEIPIVTNTGRMFIYRQASSGGEFIVPYATGGNPSGVRADGPYRIAGTPRTFEVTEEAVVQGLTVAG